MPRILWSPREILVGRTFRLPVECAPDARLDPGSFQITQTAPPRDGVTRYFLTAPSTSGEVTIRVIDATGQAAVTVRVSTLSQLRQFHRVGNTTFPRRWPMEQPYQRAKTRQTLADEVDASPLSDDHRQVAQWLLSISDAQMWDQLPPCEMPRTYTVNESEGCPRHGKAIYAFNGFYPWLMNHRPCDSLSECPVGHEKYPSNAPHQGDYLSGSHPDDGYGYIDSKGNKYFYSAAYLWRQIGSFYGHMGVLGRSLMQPDQSEPQRRVFARRMGLMLARQAVEEIYLAAVPQFRHGSHHHALHANLWGPADPAAAEVFAHSRTLANGTVDYCVNTPYSAEACARAYDAAFPYIRDDRELPGILRQLGVEVASPDDVLQLIEEMLACLIQADIDGYAHCNSPSTSVGTLFCLRALDPLDPRDVLDHLYDHNVDRLRTFVTNGFYPDGVCHEASGGYNSMHAVGALRVARHLDALRRQRPEAVSSERYPALSDDPKFIRIAEPSILTIMCGKTYAVYGDDDAGNVWSSVGHPVNVLTKPLTHGLGWARPEQVHLPAFQHRPSLFLARALHANGLVERDPRVAPMIAEHGPDMNWPSLLLDPSGIAILRAQHDKAGRDRAAMFVHYFSQPYHRHDDFMHVSLVAHDRLWSFDLGYPATHETGFSWEAKWASHNRGHIVDGDDRDVVGNGRCNLFLDSSFATAIDLEGVEGKSREWRLWSPMDRQHRRLLVMLPTVGDGVALIDLYRLRGGREHWRTFLGPQADVEWHGPSPLVERPGTAAGPDVPRKDLYRASWADACLTYIDEIRQGEGGGNWTATATCRDDQSWRLNVHGLGVSARTEAMVGRACHPMTEPKDSPYRFSPIVLRRLVNAHEPTAFDMVFEPYHESPAIRKITRLAAIDSAGADGPMGVRLEMIDGSSATVLWNPHWPSNPLPPRPVTPGLDPHMEQSCRFEGEFELRGPMGVWREDVAGIVSQTAVALGGAISRGEVRRRASRMAALGRVVEIDVVKQVAIVEPATEQAFAKGAQVRLFPRGHWYRVEEVAAVAPVAGVQPRVQLRLDMTSVLSSVRIAGRTEGELIFNTRLPLAWAGYFRGSMLLTRQSKVLVPILDIRMREDREQTFAIIDAANAEGAMAKVQEGEWADLIDYWPGCQIVEQGMEASEA